MKFDHKGLAQASSKYIAEYRTWKMRERLGSIQASLDVGSQLRAQAKIRVLSYLLE